MPLTKRTTFKYTFTLALAATLLFILTPKQESKKPKATESSKTDFLEAASDAIGNYKYTGKTNPSCDSGYLLFVDETNPQAGLQLSAKIFIGPFVEGAIITQEKGYCAVTKEYAYTQNSVTQITKVHNCPTEHTQDEAVATQFLEFKNNELIYKSLESEIECRFEKMEENT